MATHPEKRWVLDVGTVELHWEELRVDSNIKGKEIEKRYSDQLANISKESADLVKDLFGKKKDRSETISQDVSFELHGFFENIARDEGIKGEIIGGGVDLENVGYPTTGTSTAPVPASNTEPIEGAYDSSAPSKEYREGMDIQSPYKVRIAEKMSLQTNRENEIMDSMVTGSINIENQGERDVVWDIDITVDGIEKTSLEETDLHIAELDPQESTMREYQVEIPENQEFLLDVEEVIDTNPSIEETSEIFIYDPESDGQDTTLHLNVRNTGDVTLKNIRIEKVIPEEFKEMRFASDSSGATIQDDGSILWEVDELPPAEERSLGLEFKVFPVEIKSISSGEITVEYNLEDATLSGIEPTFIDGLSNQIYFVDRDERETEPDVWDCEFVFRNRSEFPMLLQRVEVTSGDENTEYETISMEPNVLLQPGANWKSEPWDLDSEDEPTFSEKILYTVLAEVGRSLSVSKVIEAYELRILSLEGEKTFDSYEVDSYRDATLDASISIMTRGDCLVEKIHIEDTIPVQFSVPDKNDITIMIGEEEIDDFDISIDGDAGDLDAQRMLHVDLGEYNERYGMLTDGTRITMKYPILIVKPKRDAVFSAPASAHLITKPTGKALSVTMDAGLVKVVHSRRRSRVGKA
ncbi:hypothetical protein GF325_11115, partial [Candidatus Bathyarchaeota archaeon]|nr:hypothetical protein [Candidatus Bathyarchaeota archaeon]